MKRDYLSRLSRAARWYLPAAEASEVLEDYRELIEQEPRSEEELFREVGTPRDAVGRLVQIRAYRKWLAVFAFLAVCVLLPAADVILSVLSEELLRRFQIWFVTGGIARTSWYAEWMFPLGTMLGLVWFQRSGRKERALPKGIVPLLLVLLLGMGWVSFLAWVIFTEQWDVLNSLFSGRAWPVWLTLGADAFAAGLLGMLGLVKARLADRRWRAVYVLGLTGAVLCVFLWKMFSSMSLDFSPGWQTPLVARYVFIAVLGLIGTGVSLC